MDLPRNSLWNLDFGLARLTAAELRRLAAASALFTVFFVMFHFFGNTHDAHGVWGTSAFLWIYHRWSDSGISMGNGDYSHGLLVPAFALFVLWHKHRELTDCPKAAAPVFLTVILLSLLLHYVGYKTQQTRLSLLAMIGLFWGIPSYLHGWRVAWILLYPCAFLVFAIPLEVLENLTLPLRFVNTRTAVAALQGLGIEVRQVGTAIYGPPFDATAELKLDVADACSGIRSLTAMMALSAGYGYLVMKSFWGKWLIFLSSIPLAMIGNMFRIIAIGIIAEAFGTDVAAGVIHDYSGFLVFGMAIALMVALAGFLHLLERRGRPA